MSAEIQNDSGVQTQKIRAVMQKKTGIGVSSRIYWESTVSPEKITYDDAYQAQADAGYHPLGYDFFDFHCQEVEGGYKATWNCSASCD
ncbi:MAG: hypothetical protein R3C24_13560 [Cyanobacteriota/Melainabacteria group bacterium]|nr:hypothetical protein [Candidatus Obscuribacterales bacterium]